MGLIFKMKILFFVFMFFLQTTQAQSIGEYQKNKDTLDLNCGENSSIEPVYFSNHILYKIDLNLTKVYSNECLKIINVITSQYDYFMSTISKNIKKEKIQEYIFFLKIYNEAVHFFQVRHYFQGKVSESLKNSK